jgi:hypothetical protein
MQLHTILPMLKAMLQIIFRKKVQGLGRFCSTDGFDIWKKEKLRREQE